MPPTEPTARVNPRPTIVCVDDEGIVRQSLKEQLKRHFGNAFAIEVLDSGETALEVVDELSALHVAIPVIISDQIMPGLKGDELLIKLHETIPAARKILLTGQASAEAIGRAVNGAQLYRYIAKPWEQADLLLTVQEAARSFERDRELHEKTRDLERVNASLERKVRTFYKFVPGQFLHVLGFGEADYEGVALGNSVERTMAVLFSDIRGFTPLVADMNAQENIDFINAYLAHMEPPILLNQGFVDSYIGDAIMALFDSPDGALRAGIGMCQALSRFNRARAESDLSPVRMGIGVNQGPLTLGTIGGPERIKCGVIGDAVNLAARVESLTRLYQVDMLISHHTVASLRAPEAFSLREVDRVKVRGRSAPVTLFEVLDAAPEALRARRLACAQTHRDALANYYAGRFEEALDGLRENLALCPDDVVTQRFITRAVRFVAHGVPSGWTGVEPLEHK